MKCAFASSIENGIEIMQALARKKISWEYITDKHGNRMGAIVNKKLVMLSRMVGDATSAGCYDFIIKDAVKNGMKIVIVLVDKKRMLAFDPVEIMQSELYEVSKGVVAMFPLFLGEEVG